MEPVSEMAKPMKKDVKKSGGKGKPVEKRKDSFFSTVRYFIFALLLALMIRVFIFEIFKIPSCSMEPTLEGVDLSHGDRVGVNKLAYTFSDVNRYDVIVLEGTTTIGGRTIKRDFIKRVVGLPGEDIEIIAGDLYAGGNIAPKPKSVQDSLWIPVYDEDFSSNQYRRFWKAADGDWDILNGAIRGNGGSFSYIHWERTLRDGKVIASGISNLYPRLSILREVRCPANGETFHPRYQDCFVEETPATGVLERGFVCPKSGERVLFEGSVNDRSQPLKSRMDVGFWLGGKSSVGDLYISAEITPRVRSGRILITLGRGRESGRRADPHTLELAVGPGIDPVYRTMEESTRLPETARLTAEQTYKVVFALWDGIVFASIDGEVILNERFLLSGKNLDGNFIRFKLAEKTVADFDNLSIKRDIYYITTDAGNINPHQVAPGRYKVPEGKYFLLGDNSPASSDCRFHMAPVARGDIIGRAFAIIWPIRHWRVLPSGGK